MWKNSFLILISLTSAVALSGCPSMSIPDGTPPDGQIITVNNAEKPMTHDAAVNYMATSMGAYVCQNIEGELVVYISSDVAGRALFQDFWRQFQVFKNMRSINNPENPYQLSSRVRTSSKGASWSLVLRRNEAILWNDTVLLEK